MRRMLSLLNDPLAAGAIDERGIRLTVELLERAAREQDLAVNNQLLRRLVLRYADAEARLSRLNADLSEKNERIEADLRAAARIQSSLLPGPLEIPGARAAWRFDPCDAVGGDMLFMERFGERTVAAAVLDVSGHGVPAAMVGVSARQALRPESGLVGRVMGSGRFHAASPREVLRMLDAEFPFSRFKKYFSIAYALLDAESGRLVCAAGGHPAPLLLSAAGGVAPLACEGPLPGVGLGDDFREDERTLSPGDRVLFVTDGAYEFVNGAGEPYGEERLHAALAAHAAAPLPELLAALAADADAFAAGTPPPDDITLLALEFTGR